MVKRTKEYKEYNNNNVVGSGSKAWNERYLEYEWNGHEFGDKRSRPLPEFMNKVEKKRHARHNMAFERFDRKVA